MIERGCLRKDGDEVSLLGVFIMRNPALQKLSSSLLEYDLTSSSDVVPWNPQLPGY